VISAEKAFCLVVLEPFAEIGEGLANPRKDQILHILDITLLKIDFSSRHFENRFANKPKYIENFLADF